MPISPNIEDREYQCFVEVEGETAKNVRSIQRADDFVRSKILGQDELHEVDVVLEDGLKKLVTTTTVKVESLNGFDDISDNWVYINSVGDVGDQIRFEIDATDGAPFLDKTFTVLIGEDRQDFTTRIVLELNQDIVDFKPYYKATKVKDNSIIHFSSKFFGEYGENKTPNSFRVSWTGNINAPRAFDDFIRRGKVTSLSRATDDPRYGVLGISGTTVSRAADIGGLTVNTFLNNGSPDMLVNGSVANPVEFTFPMVANIDKFIREVRFFGAGNGIGFTKFLSKNSPLNNGIEIEIKTNNDIIILPLIKTTEDFQNKFAFGSGDNFQLTLASGADVFLAVFISENPFPLKAINTFGLGNDDYIKIRIRDNITAGVIDLEALAFGFEQDV